jgi:polysaccharide pyruvyl transferase CsaB
MQHIFILGAYGQNNLGDDALLEVFLEQFSGADILINSAQPEQTSQRYGVRTLATYWSWPRLRRPRALLRSDLIVFGGGSLLKEVEGGFVARLLYFVRILAILLIAKIAGRPTAMLGIGIGPLEQPLYRWLSRWAAELTDLICVRDTASCELLRAIGVRRPIHVTADPVFTLSSDERRATSERPCASAQRPLVIVIPRYSLTPAQQGALAVACDHLVETRDAHILLVPFQTGYRDKYDDLPVAHATRGLMRRAEAAEVWVPATPGAALDAIGRAELVLSTRLHGLIFAALRGVGSVALSYEVKVQSFMAEIGQSGACLSLAELEAGQLPARIDQAWSRRAETRAAVSERSGVLRADAQRNFKLARKLVDQPRGPRLLNGGALLFASMTIVNAGNYLFNLILGRWLGPAAFADLSLIITLFLMVTLITSTLQTISAKFAAVYTADGDQARVAGLRSWLGRGAWLVGAALFGALALGAPLWQQFFQSASVWPFVLLGAGLPFYFALGVDRGVLQGRMRFGGLALSYQAEMWVRLLAAIALVALGWATQGAVAALTLSLVGTWLVGFALIGRRPAGTARLAGAERRQIGAFAGPVIAALIGQVLINNSDIIIVRHFFDAEAAGRYAALALIGRIVFFATVSVVAMMFPIVAQRQQRGQPHRHLLYLALGLVAAVSAGVLLAALLIPALMVQLLFGAAYLPIAPLLWLYALATALYALANVVINYRLSASAGSGSALAVLAGLAQVAGLWLFHGSLQAVVLVQVYLMGALFAALLARAFWVVDFRAGLRSIQRLKSRFQQRALSRRTLLLGLTMLVVLLLMWQVARADAPSVGHPAQQQIQLIMPSLIDSEAEHVSGAYIPGVGAVLTLDLLRGPNTLPDKPSYQGTRDWAIYLMQTFGPQLSAVPPDEQIAMSIDFYDYADTVYHQLVIACRASAAADPGRYTIWLDGKPYDEAASLLGAPAPDMIAATSAPSATTAPAPASAPPATTAQAQPSGPISATLSPAGAQDWTPIVGQWSLGAQGYAQTELGKFDLLTMLNRPVAGDFRLQVSMTFVAGEMGGGVVFNAPHGDSKNGAQMISYTSKGSYLQWGYYDESGVFQYKGGAIVPDGADGKRHTLLVRASGTSYSISLDGAEIAPSIPLDHAPGGHIGLLASTSHVLFADLRLESK